MKVVLHIVFKHDDIMHFDLTYNEDQQQEPNTVLRIQESIVLSSHHSLCSCFVLELVYAFKGHQPTK